MTPGYNFLLFFLFFYSTVRIGCILHKHRYIIITVQYEAVGSPTGPSETIFGFKTKTTWETPKFVYVFQSIITYVKTIATYNNRNV